MVIPTVNAERNTPHSEAFQAVVWHCFVSHPELPGNKNEMVKTIFLDRDGVINVPTIVDSKPYAPRKFDKFTFYEGIENLLSYLSARDYLLIVITNQPDIGNELVKLEEVEKMHHLLCESLPVTEVMVCPHSQLDDCDCRKPKPGMIKTAIAKYNIDVRSKLVDW